MTEVPMSHRREFSRVQVSPVVDLTVSGATVPDARVGNVSLQGMLVVSGLRPAAESPCAIVLRLEGALAVVRASGSVVRTTDAGFAIRFTEIVGVDSLDHLRNLIRYNSHEPGLVEQEFREHLGLKPDA